MSSRNNAISAIYASNFRRLTSSHVCITSYLSKITVMLIIINLFFDSLWWSSNLVITEKFASASLRWLFLIVSKF